MLYATFGKSAFGVILMMLKKIIADITAAFICASAVSSSFFSFNSSSASVPKLSISSLSLNWSELDKNSDGSIDDDMRQQSMSISISGVNALWSACGLHFSFPSDISVTGSFENKTDYFFGPATPDMLSTARFYKTQDKNNIFFTAAGVADSGRDGTVFTFNVLLPKDAAPGNSYDFSFFYADHDVFANCTSPLVNMIQSAVDNWSNGSISITGNYVTSTSTTTTSTTTTSTTTKPTTTSTTTTSTTTKPTTTSTTTTSTTTKPTTTSTTTTSTTTKPTTTSTTTTSTTTKPTTTSTTSTTTTTSTSTTLKPSTTKNPVLSLGDIDGNNIINAVDASLALTQYAYISTGRTSLLSDDQKIAADVNKDTIINAVDASLILFYYSQMSSHGYASF